MEGMPLATCSAVAPVGRRAVLCCRTPAATNEACCAATAGSSETVAKPEPARAAASEAETGQTAAD
jgi:hypothetical protein